MICNYSSQMISNDQPQTATIIVDDSENENDWPLLVNCLRSEKLKLAQSLHAMMAEKESLAMSLEGKLFYLFVCLFLHILVRNWGFGMKLSKDRLTMFIIESHYSTPIEYTQDMVSTTLNNFNVNCNFFTKLSGIDPCEKCINIPGGHAWLHFFMACSKLEAIAISRPVAMINWHVCIDFNMQHKSAILILVMYCFKFLS